MAQPAVELAAGGWRLPTAPGQVSSSGLPHVDLPATLVEAGAWNAPGPSLASPGWIGAARRDVSRIVLTHAAGAGRLRQRTAPSGVEAHGDDAVSLRPGR